jgi:hypothetical protein
MYAVYMHFMQYLYRDINVFIFEQIRKSIFHGIPTMKYRLYVLVKKGIDLLFIHLSHFSF